MPLITLHVCRPDSAGRIYMFVRILIVLLSPSSIMLRT